MFSKRVSVLVATVLAALALGVFAIPAQAALRHIDGTVVSKNAANHTFRLTTQSGDKLRIRVNSATKFQRIAGFSGLHVGLQVEVEARQTANGLLATHVETRGGGNGGGGGSNDGPNHT